MRGGRPQRRNAWSRPWSWAQLLSHLAVLYCIACFGAVLQARWLRAGGVWLLALAGFWGVLAVTLLLYFYVCLADTRYREVPVDLLPDDAEPRRCEECAACISHVRVKHCHICDKCVGDFDHHCRYLNSCIAGKTYRAWSAFVCGLLVLMVACCVGGWGEIAPPMELDRFPLVAVGIMASLASLLAPFLACLLAQHLCLAIGGTTTLEYVKQQDAGFPGLPQKGWRLAVRRGECCNCHDHLELVEIENIEEVWFCTVCQADLSKAQVKFFNCEECGACSVCIPCRRLAERPERQVVTSRVSTLRREPPWMTSEDDSTGAGRNLRFPSSCSTTALARRGKPSRNNLSALIANVEGSDGDTRRESSSFCGGRRDEEDSSSGDESEPSSEITLTESLQTSPRK